MSAAHSDAGAPDDGADGEQLVDVTCIERTRLGVRFGIDARRTVCDVKVYAAACLLAPGVHLDQIELHVVGWTLPSELALEKLFPFGHRVVRLHIVGADCTGQPGLQPQWLHSLGLAVVRIGCSVVQADANVAADAQEDARIVQRGLAAQRASASPGSPATARGLLSQESGKMSRTQRRAGRQQLRGGSGSRRARQRRRLRSGNRQASGRR